MVDRGHEALDVLDAQAGGQVLEAVGLVDAAAHALGGGHAGDLDLAVDLAGLDVVHHVHDVLGTAEVGAGVLKAAAGDVLEVVAADDAVAGTRLARAGVASSGDVALVAEALHVLVEPQVAVGAPGAGRAAAQGHVAARGGIDEAAGPAQHLDARTVAGAGHAAAVEVLLEAAGALVLLLKLVEQGPAHVGVLDVAAGAGDDCLAVELDVTVGIGVVDDDAGHGAVLSLHDLVALVAQEHLSAQGVGLGKAGHLDVAKNRGSSDAAVALAAVEVAHHLDGGGPGLRAGGLGVTGVVEALVVVVVEGGAGVIESLVAGLVALLGRLAVGVDGKRGPVDVGGELLDLVGVEHGLDDDLAVASHVIGIEGLVDVLSVGAALGGVLVVGEGQVAHELVVQVVALGVLDGLLHAGEHVVEALAGVVDVGGNDLLAHAAARAGRELVDDLTEVVLGKAGVLHEVGVPGGSVLADVHEVGALFAHGDLCASLGEGKRGLRAGMAATDDDGVEVVDLLGDLHVVRHAQPVAGASVAEGASLSGSCLAGRGDVLGGTHGARATLAAAFATLGGTLALGGCRGLLSKGRGSGQGQRHGAAGGHEVATGHLGLTHQELQSQYVPVDARPRAIETAGWSPCCARTGFHSIVFALPKRVILCVSVDSCETEGMILAFLAA